MSKRKKMIIHPYMGFASNDVIYAKGRVLVDKAIDYSPERNVLKNLLNAYKRFNSAEKRAARVRIRSAADQWDLTCDDEGYYTLESGWNPDVTFQNWAKLKVELITDFSDSPLASASCPIHRPHPESGLAIIADIDDTLLETGTGSRTRLSVLANTFFRSPMQRRSIPGMANVLTALSKDVKISNQRSVFYLSNSPWNMYNYLHNFILMNGLPTGPILLRDFGLHLLKKRTLAEKHKFQYLQLIFDLYPWLSFVLIGDTASSDADFYIEMAHRHPNRVAAIYLREPRNSSNSRRIRRLKTTSNLDQLRIVRSADDIAEDAMSRGLFF